VQIFEKFVATLVLPIIVMGCSHVPSSEGTRQAETPYTWHDGSKQGLYGIGKDWSIEILPGEYGEITELLRFFLIQPVVNLFLLERYMNGLKMMA